MVNYTNTIDLAENLVCNALWSAPDEFNAGLKLGAVTLEHMRQAGEKLFMDVKLAVLRHQGKSDDLIDGFSKAIGHHWFFSR